MPTWRKLYQKTTESLDINDLPDDFTRLLWVLLPLGLDREGRGLDNPSWIKAKLMPLRTDVSLDQIALAVDCLAQRGMIQRYQVDGRGYFLIPTWHKYQGDTSREAASILPPPTPRSSDVSRPSPSAPDPLLTHLPPDSDSESDPESDPDPDSPAPAKTLPPAPQERDDPDPLIFYQKTFDLPSLPPDQEAALRALTAQYGPARLCEVIAWAASAGIPQSRALRAIRTALPGWQRRPRSPAAPPARPPMLDVLDRLRKEHPHGRKP